MTPAEEAEQTLAKVSTGENIHTVKNTLGGETVKEMAPEEKAERNITEASTVDTINATDTLIPIKLADQITAPAEQIAAPAEQITAHAEQITAPAEQIAAPTDQIAAPADQIAAPAEQIAAPADQIAAPADQIAAPAEQIAAPAEQIAAPAEQIAAPAEQITAPAEQIAAPAEQIAAPAEQITAPAEQIAAPAEQIAAPAEQITAPAEQITAPAEQIAAPAEQRKVYSVNVFKMCREENSQTASKAFTKENIKNSTKRSAEKRSRVKNVGQFSDSKVEQSAIKKTVQPFSEASTEEESQNCRRQVYFDVEEACKYWTAMRKALGKNGTRIIKHTLKHVRHQIKREHDYQATEIFVPVSRQTLVEKLEQPTEMTESVSRCRCMAKRNFLGNEAYRHIDGYKIVKTSEEGNIKEVHRSSRKKVLKHSVKVNCPSCRVRIVTNRMLEAGWYDHNYACRDSMIHGEKEDQLNRTSEIDPKRQILSSNKVTTESTESRVPRPIQPKCSQADKPYPQKLVAWIDSKSGADAQRGDIVFESSNRGCPNEPVKLETSNQGCLNDSVILESSSRGCPSTSDMLGTVGTFVKKEKPELCMPAYPALYLFKEGMQQGGGSVQVNSVFKARLTEKNHKPHTSVTENKVIGLMANSDSVKERSGKLGKQYTSDSSDTCDGSVAPNDHTVKVKEEGGGSWEQSIVRTTHYNIESGHDLDIAMEISVQNDNDQTDSHILSDTVPYHVDQHPGLCSKMDQRSEDDIPLLMEVFDEDDNEKDSIDEGEDDA